MADTFILCFLVAFSVGLGVWALANIGFQLAAGDKRKLKKRLVSSRDSSNVSEAQRSIRTDIEQPGLAGKLMKFQIFRTIDALVQLSYPELGLPKFLAITASIFGTLFLLVLAISMNPIVAVVCAALGGVGPLLYLTKKKIKRQKMLGTG